VLHRGRRRSAHHGAAPAFGDLEGPDGRALRRHPDRAAVDGEADKSNHDRGFVIKLLVPAVRLRSMEEAYKALLDEIRRRLQATKDDPNVRNTDGSNYWGPYVTRASTTASTTVQLSSNTSKASFVRLASLRAGVRCSKLTGWTSPSSRWCLLRTSRFAASSTTRTGR
jgi:hypothetical protein